MMHFAYIDPGSGLVYGPDQSWLPYLVAGVILVVLLLAARPLIRLLKKHPRLVLPCLAVPLLALAGYLIARQVGSPASPASSPHRAASPAVTPVKKPAQHPSTAPVTAKQPAKAPVVKSAALPAARRIVILGIDGMSPVIAERLMAQGKLPHFAALKRDGAYRRLATTNPAQSPVAWATFATGLNPGKHGLYDFIRRDPKTYRLALSTANLANGKATPVIQAKRFWNYATDLGVPSVVLNCPLTFPPERINGRMLAGMGVPDILGTEGTFTFYTSENTVGQAEGGRIVPLPGVMTEYSLELYGPKHHTATGAANLTLPMSVTHDPDNRTVQIAIDGGQPFTLRQGQWSAWQPAVFRLDAAHAINGIVQFYLVEAGMDRVRLYAGPIHYDPRAPSFPIAYPPAYAKELTGKIGLFSTQGMPNDTWSLNENRLPDDAFLQRVQTITRQREKVLDLELARSKHGIVFAYFDALDVVQHMFWRREAGDPQRGAVEAWYGKMDDLLGHMRGQLGKDDILIVLSDHGFAGFRRAANVNAWLQRHGYLALKQGKQTGGDLLLDVDWGQTRAYAIGFGAVYLNLRGREGRGIVDPRDAPKLKKELTLALLAWQDGQAPVVHHVYRSEAIFQGKYQRQAPDLFLGFNDGYRASWQTALGAVPATLIDDNDTKWNGDHLIDPALVPGVLFCTEPLAANPTLCDLTPTILHACGCSDAQLDACHLDGHPLFARKIPH